MLEGNRHVDACEAATDAWAYRPARQMSCRERASLTRRSLRIAAGAQWPAARLGAGRLNSSPSFRVAPAANCRGTFANNGYDRQLAIAAIASGHADMVAFGQPYIGNPDLVERLRRNAALTMANKATYCGGGAEGYTDYKTLAEVSGA